MSVSKKNRVAKHVHSSADIIGSYAPAGVHKMLSNPGYTGGDLFVTGKTEIPCDAPSKTNLEILESIFGWAMSYCTVNVASGSTSVTVYDASKFVVGQVITVADATKNEQATLESKSGNTLTLASGLSNTYSTSQHAHVIQWCPAGINNPSRPLRFKDNNSLNWLDYFLLISSDNYNAPLSYLNQGWVCQKDGAFGGFVSAQQGQYWYGHGLNTPTDAPKDVMAHSHDYNLTDNVAAGATSIPVYPGVIFLTGVPLIIEDNNHSEMVIVKSKTLNTVTIQQPLQHSYSTAAGAHLYEPYFTKWIVKADGVSLANVRLNQLQAREIVDLDGQPHNQQNIVCGSASTDVNGEATVMFAEPFEDPPKIVCTVHGGTSAVLRVVQKSATFFTVKTVKPNQPHKHKVANAEVTAEFALEVAEENEHTHSLNSHTHSLNNVQTGPGTSHSHECGDEDGHVHDVPVANHRHLLDHAVAANITPEFSVENSEEHYHEYTLITHIHLFHNNCYATDEENAGAHTHTGDVTVNTATPTTSDDGAHDHSVSGSATSAGSHTHDVSGSAASAGSHNHNLNMASGTTTGGPSGYPHEHNYGYTVATTSDAGSHTHNVSGSAASAGRHSHGLNAATGTEPNHYHSVEHAHTASVEIDSDGKHNHHVVGSTMGPDGVIPSSYTKYGGVHSHELTGGGHVHPVVGDTDGVDATVGGSPIGPSTSYAGSPHSHPIGDEDEHTHSFTSGSVGNAEGDTGVGSAHTHELTGKPPYARGLTMYTKNGVGFGVGALLQSTPSGVTELYTGDDEGAEVGVAVSFDWIAIVQ